MRAQPGDVQALMSQQAQVVQLLQAFTTGILEHSQNKPAGLDSVHRA